ncbi:hypothetical protein NQ314_000744 [Rhamnusium bicolor]|uniref:BRK domain-containing protein n=1 Tax=Rhamnusium bicolor TaxID=1586634 RepID=A0AAV8ZX81_9CUCU|nr:hypothetical protein NQ314_000744 [Rhamnusium bicolor]
MPMMFVNGWHGLGRTDYYLLNDPDLSFHEILRKKVHSDSLDTKDAIKLESHEDILKFDKDEILVKLEKGEGTLKIEKVAVKKEPVDEKKIEEESKVNLTIVKSDKCDSEGDNDVEENTTKDSTELKEEQEVIEEIKERLASNNKESEKKKYDAKDEQKAGNDVKGSEKIDSENDTETEQSESGDSSKPKEEKPTELTKKFSESDNDLCSKQAAELKAMFPDLEVIQPLSRLSQVDTFVLRDKQGSGALDFSETTVAQLFNNAVKWPKEYAIQVRLQHIIYAVETKEWPATKSFSAYATGIGNEFDIPIHELPAEPPKRESSTPMSFGEPDVISISTDRSGANKKRKRHIAIDVETERAKLHALLNSSHMANPLIKHGMCWENDDSEESRRSTPVQSNLQPPPAHQQASRLSMTNLKMPYDLPYHTPPAKTIGQTTVIPGTSSTLTPIDLSSSIPKSSEKSSNRDIQNEKRRKLDEIVLGLSAAKEQSLFPEPAKKPTVTPSVTVTPTSAPVSSSHNPSQKPFTITVTSVPSSAPSNRTSTIQNMLPSLSTNSKDSFSTFLAQAEQQNLMLKKQQQQQRKSYEAMIADIGKVSDFSSKVNSYSHEAKVNKWLAEQNAALAEQPLGADYLSPRRRRPRVDPTLLDWKKLTGDENVAVIHRVTGKKLTGPKAPTLKRLGQWLMENSMYDIDPKWSELVKERGNLSHDLQKRLPGQSSSKNKNMPGRPPLLASPTGSTSSVSSANLTTSMPSSISFPSLNSSNLAGLNSNLLTGLSGLGQFDPKTNPLLMPFSGLSNMGTLGSMGGLGTLTNMNLFANLAGLGLPGLGGMDAATLASTTGESNKNSSSKTSISTNKPQKPQEAHSSNKSQSNSSSSISTTNPFPFFFPNPSLLYTPLGLGGLNPFTLQPGMSAAYDSLAQQCGLLNGSLNPAASSNSSSKLNKSNASRPPSLCTTTTTTSSQNKPARSSSRDAHLQQLLLPPDTQILESISKAATSLDVSLKQSKSDKKEDKRKALESLRGMLPTDFSSSIKDKKTGIPGLADFTKLLEAQVSQNTSKKTHELQMKEALEQFSKSNAELMAKALAEEQTKLMLSKRPREICDFSPAEEGLQSNKKMKESPDKSPVSIPIAHVINEQEGVDIETLLPPSTVVKSSNLSPVRIDVKEKSPEPVIEDPTYPDISESKSFRELERGRQVKQNTQLIPGECSGRGDNCDNGAFSAAACGERGTFREKLEYVILQDILIRRKKTKMGDAEPNSPLERREGHELIPSRKGEIGELRDLVQQQAKLLESFIRQQAITNEGLMRTIGQPMVDNTASAVSPPFFNSVNNHISSAVVATPEFEPEGTDSNASNLNIDNANVLSSTEGLGNDWKRVALALTTKTPQLAVEKPSFRNPESQNPVLFLSKLERYVRSVGASASESLEIIQDCLAGPAADWRDMQKESWTTYDNFRQSFLEFYWSEERQYSERFVPEGYVCNLGVAHAKTDITYVLNLFPCDPIGYTDYKLLYTKGFDLLLKTGWIMGTPLDCSECGRQVKQNTQLIPGECSGRGDNCDNGAFSAAACGERGTFREKLE